MSPFKSLLAAAFALTLSVPAVASLRGPNHARHQLLTRCYADCATYREICRSTFRKGRIYRQCARRLLYTCVNQGGTCSVGPCPVCAPDQICVNGSCFPKPKPKPQAPVNLPAGNYNVSFCASGAVNIPCQPVGVFPIAVFNVFEQAVQSAMTQFLAANGAGGCALGAGQVVAAEGGVDVTFSATCTDQSSGNTISESVVIQVRP